MSFTFAHAADCHLGSWGAHPELSELPLKAFDSMIDTCIERKLDFILISGDLLDTSLPTVDVLRRCASALRRAAVAGIRVYVIPGSHDFSASGKTMISVFESAGLLKNVAHGSEENGRLRLHHTKDKTGAHITGIIGRRTGLERTYYENLAGGMPEGFSIFMMHSAITEYKPQHLQKMDSIPLSLLPKGYSYYASGHVHQRFEAVENGARIVFPGPLFPAEFRELEKGTGSFVISDDSGKIEWVSVPVCKIKNVEVSADEKTPSEIECEIKDALTGDMGNTVVLVRLRGTLKSGRVYDIDFRSIAAKAGECGALALKKNISQLREKEMELIAVKPELASDIEEKLLSEHKGQFSIFSDEQLVVKELMRALSEKKGEMGASAYEERIIAGSKKVLGV